MPIEALFIWWRRRPDKSVQEINKLLSKKANETIEELNLGIEFREVITEEELVIGVIDFEIDMDPDARGKRLTEKVF